MPVCAVSEIDGLFRQFAEEREAELHEVFCDGDRLFARCVFKNETPLTPNDKFRSGVAVFADALEVEVRPYLLRQVCTNGAIITRSGSGQVFETRVCELSAVQAAFDECSQAESTAPSMRELLALQRQPFDRALMISGFMSRHSRHVDVRVMLDIVQEFMRSEDRSMYGFVNAITAIARQTPDPALRWRLEKIGGGAPAWLLDFEPCRSGQVALTFEGVAPSSGRELQPA